MVRAKALSIKASSRLSNVVSTTLVATILAAGCVQSVDDVVGSPTSSATIPAGAPSIEPSRTQPSSPPPLPTPTLTVNQQNVIWEHDVRMALADTDIWLLIPYVTAEQLDEVNRRIVIRILCQEHLNRAWEVLEEQLPPLGIPIGLVDVEVSGYVSPTTPPPDACTLTADEVLSTQISEYIASTPMPLPTATPTPEVVTPSDTPPTSSPRFMRETAPVPTMTAHESARFWEFRVSSALSKSPMISLVPRLSMHYLDGFNRKIVIGVACQENIDKALEVVREHLPSIGLPEDAAIVAQFPVATIGGDPPPSDIFHCVPPEVVDPVTGVSSPGFGGYYWEDGVAYIYLLEPSQESGEKLVFAEVGEGPEVRVLQGRYTWEQLMEWEDILWNSDWRLDTIFGKVRLLPKYNRIELEWESTGVSFDVAEATEVITGMGIPCDAVFLNENDPETRPGSATDVDRKRDYAAQFTLCDAHDSGAVLEMPDFRSRFDLLWVTIHIVPEIAGIRSEGDGAVYVYVTDGAEKTLGIEDVRRAVESGFGADLTEGRELHLIPAKYSIHQLHEWLDAIHFRFEGEPNFVHMSVQDGHNRIEVEVDSLDAAAAIEAFLTSQGIPSDAITVLVMEPIEP